MVELGQGSLEYKELIGPGSFVLDQPMTVLVRYDSSRKTTIFFDFSTMLPLYTSSTRMVEGGEKVIVTKDCKGRALFLTTCPCNGKRLIFRAPKDVTCSPSVSSLDSLASLTSYPSHSSSSEATREGSLASWSKHPRVLSVDSTTLIKRGSAHQPKKLGEDVPCVAQIDLDRSGAAVTAFLNVVVWKGSGPQLESVYKAVQLPQVKWGVVVVDMQGQVVGKSSCDDRRMELMINVAQGADLLSVVALIQALLGKRC